VQYFSIQSIVSCYPHIYSNGPKYTNILLRLLLIGLSIIMLILRIIIIQGSFILSFSVCVVYRIVLQLIQT
jgi:hypothetical protein